VKTAIFCTCGSNNWETVADRWVHAARDLASSEYCLFIYATFCVIATGASPGQTKNEGPVRKNGDFYRAMLCMQYMPSCDVHPSV